MFNFLQDMNIYNKRLVDNSVLDGSTIIDTCRVSDGEKPFETGIQCPKYNNNKWVIVEGYNTKEDAQKGHNKWVGVMSANNLPEKLVDCGNSEISKLCSIFGFDMEFPAEF